MDYRNKVHGFNAGIVLELYERYRKDPDSVDRSTRDLFEERFHPRELEPSKASLTTDGVVCVVRLADSIRALGHLDAQLDPLGQPPPGDPALHPDTYGLSEDVMLDLPASLVGGPIAKRTENAWEAVQELRSVYSSTRGYDYAHILDPHQRNWLAATAESGRYRPPQHTIDEKALLDRLTRVDAFETFLHRAFPGKFRFSLQGLDLLVPVLDEVISRAAESRVQSILIGMAHRGRLNVLAHVLNKPYRQILAEFKDPARDRKFRDELGWTGDVKYHLGALRAVKENNTVQLVVRMPPNPSHVEAIDPVIEGMARAGGTRVDEAGPPRFDPGVTLPILVHGDAAFPGQGVVGETLNLSRLAGYDTGGTIHIIANNQLGYTTDPTDTRSTLYASDLAKGFEIPILHVNADDPEACIEAARTAFAFLSRFRKDFVIDLVGYRRFGHNESDEPSFTQPTMYSQIQDHPSVYEIWGRELEEQNVIEEGVWKKQHGDNIHELQDELDSLEAEEALPVPDTKPASPQAAREIDTSVPLDRLRRLYDSFLALPESFNPNPKIERARKKRSGALDDAKARTVTWPIAEDLAFASLLADGIAIRVTGEDTERGTFSQRHAVLHDFSTGERYVPLQSLPQAKAAFEVHNSPLTENATLGFEVGYNIQEPQRLVIWEAQYGDFVNGAQVMVDELLVSARAKWGQSPSLVLLLPHGYEGHGPDHSSAYLERFLELSAEDNLRVANCTTAAQYFHLLRLHAKLLDSDPLPLVVFAPKSLLRHPLASSTPQELAEGRWLSVLDDERMVADDDRADRVRRLVLCSGKLYVDLVSSEHYERDDPIAIARVEQLYPFPGEEVIEVVRGYPHLEEVTWIQEEPENMGAWEYVRPILRDLSEDLWPLSYVGRPRSASPAEGSTTQHQINQDALIRLAFQMEPKVARDSDVVLEDVSSGKER